MGWNMCAASKDEAIQKFTSGWDPGVVIADQAVVGNHLWQLIEANGERRIVLALLEKEGEGRFAWGYKDIDEGSHPYHYDCPVRILRGSTVPDTSGWRAKCFAVHAEKRNRKNQLAAIRPGDTITFDDGSRKATYVGEYGKGSVAIEVDGGRYRLAKSRITAVL